MSPALLRIEIVYALEENIWRQTLEVPPASVVRDALALSELLQRFSELSLDGLRVGVYGQVCGLDRPLQDADRVEIYRPLIFDPMVSRRRRALHRMQKKDRPPSRPRRKSGINTT
jgi:putative ubiquitin-RnfH superfamily antitoxin RatB of RatAB toxin-antitoxin module